MYLIQCVELVRYIMMKPDAPKISHEMNSSNRSVLPYLKFTLMLQLYRLLLHTRQVQCFLGMT